MFVAHAHMFQNLDFYNFLWLSVRFWKSFHSLRCVAFTSLCANLKFIKLRACANDLSAILILCKIFGKAARHNEKSFLLQTFVECLNNVAAKGRVCGNCGTGNCSKNVDDALFSQSFWVFAFTLRHDLFALTAAIIVAN